MKVDLHIHTTYSDGVFSPEKIVDTAIDAGLDAIAITDHDNVLAYPIALNYAKKIADSGGKALEILPGVEINTIYKDIEIHILGYFMNRDDSDFQAMLKSQQKARIEQTEQILHLLNKKEGIHVTFDKLKSLVADGGSIGRPHIAKAITLAAHLVVADIYAARETDDLGISSADLQKRIQELGTPCEYFPTFDEIENFLLSNCQEGDLLITMGAGDVVTIGEQLLGK